MIVPPIDFRIGCRCAACELGVLLWYTEDEHPARAAWEVFWAKKYDEYYDAFVRDDRLKDGALRRPCLWQLRRIGATEATPKPTAYKICSGKPR